VRKTGSLPREDPITHQLRNTTRRADLRNSTKIRNKDKPLGVSEIFKIATVSVRGIGHKETQLEKEMNAKTDTAIIPVSR